MSDNTNRLSAALNAVMLLIDDFKKHDELWWESFFCESVPYDYARKVLAGNAKDDHDSALLRMCDRWEVAPDCTKEDLKAIIAIRTNIA